MRLSCLSVLLLVALMPAALFAAAQPIQLLVPQTHVVEGSQLDYGTVGPGQTFSIQIYPIVTDASSGRYLGRWDMASVSDLPAGWSSRPSGQYGNPIELEVTVDPLASEGDYNFSVNVDDQDSADHIGGRVSFTVMVHVSTHVLDARVSPLSQEVGAGQPARFTITLTNLATAPDTFRVSAQGVKGWSYQTNEYLAPGESKSFNYEVVGTDEAYYPMSISVQSFSSPQIHFEQPVSLQVRTNLGADYRATSHGVLLYPPVMLPVYSMAGILGLIVP
ncbi:Uncharacterised protein [uncultured archaeon]|nr:Uncharacterised protein [uncultured archaeon]